MGYTHQALDRSQAATSASRLDLDQQSTVLGIYPSPGERIMTLFSDITLIRLLGLRETPLPGMLVLGGSDSQGSEGRTLRSGR